MYIDMYIYAVVPTDPCLGLTHIYRVNPKGVNPYRKLEFESLRRTGHLSRAFRGGGHIDMYIYIHKLREGLRGRARCVAPGAPANVASAALPGALWPLA